MMRTTRGVIGVVALAMMLWAPGAMAQLDIVTATVNYETWCPAGNGCIVPQFQHSTRLTTTDLELAQCLQAALDSGDYPDVVAEMAAIQAQALDEHGGTAEEWPAGGSLSAYIAFMVVGMNADDGGIDLYGGYVDGWAAPFGAPGTCGSGLYDLDASACFSASTSIATVEGIYDSCFADVPGDGAGEGGGEAGVPNLTLDGESTVGVSRPVSGVARERIGAVENPGNVYTNIGTGRTREYTVTVTVPINWDVDDDTKDAEYTLDVVLNVDRPFPGYVILTPEDDSDSQTVTVLNQLHYDAMIEDLDPAVPADAAVLDTYTAAGDKIAQVVFSLTSNDDQLFGLGEESGTAAVSIVATLVPTGVNKPNIPVQVEVEMLASMSVTVEYWDWYEGCDPKQAFDAQGTVWASYFGCGLQSAQLPDVTRDLAADPVELGLTDNQLLFAVDENHVLLSISAGERALLEEWKRNVYSVLVTDWDMVNLDYVTGDLVIDSYTMNLLAYSLCREVGAGDVHNELDKGFMPVFAAQDAYVAGQYETNRVMIADWVENMGNIMTWLVSETEAITLGPTPMPSVPGRVVTMTAASGAGDEEFVWEVESGQSSVFITPSSLDSSIVDVLIQSIPLNTDIFRVWVTVHGMGTGCAGMSLVDPLDPCGAGDGPSVGDTNDDGFPDDASMLSTRQRIVVLRPVQDAEDRILVSACPDAEEDFLGAILTELGPSTIDNPDRRDLIAAQKGAAAKKAASSAKRSSIPVAGYVADIQDVLDLWAAASAESLAEDPDLFDVTNVEDLVNLPTDAVGGVNGLSVRASARIFTTGSEVDRPLKVTDYLSVYSDLAAFQGLTGAYPDLMAGLVGVSQAYTYIVGEMFNSGYWYSGLSLVSPASIGGHSLMYILTSTTGALNAIKSDLLAARSGLVGGWALNGFDDLQAFEAAVDTAISTAGKLDRGKEGDPHSVGVASIAWKIFDDPWWVHYAGRADYLGGDGLGPLPAGYPYNEFYLSVSTVYSNLGNYSNFDYEGVNNSKELSALIFSQVGGLRRSREDYVNAAAQLNPFFPGNPEVPVTGVVGLGLLAGACATAGVTMLRRKRS